VRIYEWKERCGEKRNVRSGDLSPWLFGAGSIGVHSGAIISSIQYLCSHNMTHKKY
jgi:hypothetical protein